MHKEPVAATSASRSESLDDYDAKQTTLSTGSRWNPRNWSRRTIIIAIVAAVIIIVAIIVGAVEGTKQTAYPDYTKLTYTLQDTFQGEDFFDNFDYFDGYDPSAGFVQYVLPISCTYTADTTLQLHQR